MTARTVTAQRPRRRWARPTSPSRPGAESGAWLIVVAVLVAAGLLLDSYRVLLLTEMLIWALLATSFNLLLGYTGLLSFGHAAYFAGGAYACGFAMVRFEMPLVVGVLAGLLVGGGLAAILGVLCVRVNRIYFALLTLAFGMLVYTLVFQARELTGGSDGYNLYELGEIQLLGFELLLGRPQVFYAVTLVFVVLGMVVLRAVTRSPFGQMLRAIRENGERVAFLGVPVRRYQYKAFVIAGAAAGLAGGLIAPFLRVAHPDLAHWTTSAEVVLGTVLGGPAFFVGPAIGTGVLIWLESVVTGWTVYWPLAMGVTLVILVVFLPGGIVGALADVRVKLRRRRT